MNSELYRCLSFIFGVVIGSFLNVCIYRIPQGISVAKGRSFCPKCGTQLTARDLVPVLSWVFLRGRCRTCGEPISPRYPLVELLGGLLFLLAAWRYGVSLRALLTAGFFACLMVVAFIDQDTGYIPDGAHLFLLALGVANLLCPPRPVLWEQLLGAAAASVPMLLLAYLCGGFGYGDVKLMAASGLFLGWQLTLLACFFAVVLGGLRAAFLLLRRRAGRKSEMPFGPWLALGMVLAVAVGPSLLTWYGSLL